MMKLLRHSVIILAWACGIAHAESDTAVALMVFPAENLTKSSSLSWIGECLTVSISESLEMPGVRVIPRAEIARFVESSDLPPSAPLSRASMIRVAQQAAANHLVFGSYSGTADAIRIGMYMLDLKSMKLSNEITTAGSSLALPQMENELAWEILNQKGLARGVTRDKYRQRTRTIPNLAYTYYVRSLGQTDPEARLKLTLKAVELYGDIPDAQFYVGNHYYKKDDCPRAVRHLQQARVKPPQLLESQFMLGICHSRQGSYSDAARAFSGILDYARPPEVLNNLGASYLRVGELPPALKYLAEARNLARNDAVIAINLALAHHLLGNQAEALAVLEEALKFQPNVGILHYLLGVVAAAKGETEKANAATQQASRLGIDAERLRARDIRTLAQILPLWRTR